MDEKTYTALISGMVFVLMGLSFVLVASLLFAGIQWAWSLI